MHLCFHLLEWISLSECLCDFIFRNYQIGNFIWKLIGSLQSDLDTLHMFACITHLDYKLKIKTTWFDSRKVWGAIQANKDMRYLFEILRSFYNNRKWLFCYGAKVLLLTIWLYNRWNPIILSSFSLFLLFAFFPFYFCLTLFFIHTHTHANTICAIFYAN